MDNIETNDDGEVIIRNDEQVQMMGVLEALKDAVHKAKTEAYIDTELNESLRGLQRVDWTEIECVRTERWLDSNGDLGWRAYIGGPDRNNPKLQALLRSKLLNDGWDHAEVVAA